MAECRGFRVFGLVQGVWFRESTRQQALMLGITGYAINCEDGSVEVLACGSSEKVSQLRDWLGHGPQLARVERIEEFPVQGTCRDIFMTG